MKMRVFGNFGIGLGAQILSMLGGIFGGVLKMIEGIVNNGFKAVMDYNQRGIAFARQLGMNFQQAQAYTEVLVTRAKTLGKVYGITAEQVFELQENLAQATGKALMLNDQEAEKMVQINKMVGSNVANEFMSEIMNHMGGQLNAVQGAVSKAYATGAKSGLNAVKFSEKVAKNLSMANRLSFKNGVDGIIKMTALSEKLGFNLQSIEQAASNFMDLDKAIENSAHLQMLGGAAGAYGGNPLEMSYEAHYDPEAFTQRMTDMLKGLGTFDKKTGMARVNGMNMEMAREIAKAVGMSAEEAVNIAKKQAEMRFKEGAYGAKFNTSKFTKEQKDFIMNKSYIQDGKLMINDIHGKAHNISSGNLDAKILEELQTFNDMSDREILESQAQTLVSLSEKATGIQTSLSATIAEPIIQNQNIIYGALNKLSDFLCNNVGPKIASFIEKGLKWAQDHAKLFNSIADILTDTIGGTLSFFRDNWKTILGIFIGIKGLKFIGKTINLGANTRRAWKNFKSKNFGGGSPAAATRKGGGGPAAANPKTPTTPKTVEFNGKTYRESGGKWQVKQSDGNFKNLDKRQLKNIKPQLLAEQKIQAAKNATNTINTTTNSTTNTVTNTAKSGSKFKNIIAKGGKIGKIGGGVFAAGLAAVQSISAISSYKKTQKELNAALSSGEINKKEYNAHLDEARIEKNKNVGGAIGSGVGAAIGASLGSIIPVFGTVLGGAAGAWVGDKIGGLIGENWDTVTELASDVWEGIKGFASNAWNVASKAASTVWNGVKNFAKGAWDVASKAASTVWNSIGTVASDVWNGISTVATNVWNSIGTVASDVWNGISTIASDVWNGISTVASGAWNGISTVASGAWNGISTVASGAWNGVSTIASDVWNGISTVASGAWNGVSTVATNVWNSISTVATNVWNSIGTVASDVWNGISTVATNVWNSIGTVASDVWNGIGKGVSDMYGGAKTVVSDVYGGAKTVVSDILHGAKDLLSNDSSNKKTSAITQTTNILTNNAIISNNLSNLNKEPHTNGGIVGGNSYQGDKIITSLNSGEMVLNMNHQNGLFNFIKSLSSPLSSPMRSPINNITKNLYDSNVINNGNSNIKSVSIIRNISSFISDLFSDRNINSNISSNVSNASILNPIQNITSLLTNNNDVKAKPVGEKEYIYIPKNNSVNGVTELSVKDINVNISGTIRLDGGNSTKDININNLLKDHAFIASLKDIITNSINTSINSGRYMNDNSTLRGGLNTTLWGR